MIIMEPGKSPDLMAGNPWWPRNGLLGPPTKGLGGGPPDPAPFRCIGDCALVWRALARSSKNISSWELAEWDPPTPPPPDDDHNDDDEGGGAPDDDDDDYVVRMMKISSSGDGDVENHDEDGDDDDDGDGDG